MQFPPHLTFRLANFLLFRMVCLISRFHRDVDEICALLGYYATYDGNTNVSGLIGCPERPVKYYHHTLRNTPEAFRFRYACYKQT